MNTEDVLVEWTWLIADLEKPGDGILRDCIADLAAALRAERELRAEVERKAIEQSEYIQSHGLTEYEMARLKARVAELESDATLGRLVRAMPTGWELFHLGVSDPANPRDRWDVRIWKGQWAPYDSFDGDTPEATLEAARKETP